MVYNVISIIAPKVQVDADVQVAKKRVHRPSVLVRQAYRTAFIRSIYGYGGLLLVTLILFFLA